MIIQENYFDLKQKPDYCTEENLVETYNYYLKNLKNSPFMTKWVSLNEIEEHKLIGWKCIGDRYLDESEDDRNKLALDIYENGTYFPLFLLKKEGKPYKLRDGAHRLYVMRELQKQGLWEKNKKVMVATDEEINGYVKGEERVFYLPLKVSEQFKENYSFVYNEFYSQKSISYVNSKKDFAEYRTCRGGYLATACISLLIRNALFEYKQKHGVPIKPSPVINSYDAWLSWRGY